MAGLRSVWVPLRGLWDPRPLVGGNAPPPGPVSAPRWDPEPALDLAIRPAAVGSGLRAGRSGGGLRRGRGLSLARVCETGQGEETETEGEAGLSSVAGLPQGFRGTGR
jgi:hypothetical protein